MGDTIYNFLSLCYLVFDTVGKDFCDFRRDCVYIFDILVYIFDVCFTQED
jgi:hypothetical protein